MRGKAQRVQPVLSALRQREPAVLGGSPAVPAETCDRPAQPLICIGDHFEQEGEARERLGYVFRLARRGKGRRPVKRCPAVCNGDDSGILCYVFLTKFRQVVVAHRVLAGVGRVVELVPYKRVDGCIRRPRRGGEHAHSQRREGEREGEKDHLQPVCHAFCHFHSSLIWAFAAVYARRNRQAGAGTPPPALSARGRNRCGSSAQKI